MAKGSLRRPVRSRTPPRQSVSISSTERFPLRFLHTSDWQIGKAFRFVDDETLGVLRAERLDVITRIGRLAVEHQASAVLVAGDIYDVAQVTIETLLKPIERMRQFPSIEWHLIPGNHDPHTLNGPWDRLFRVPLPQNVVVHTTTEPRPIGDGSAWIVPSVLTQRSIVGDPTAAMDGAATPERSLRIGLAHGSIRSFGSTDTSTNNLIAIDRAATARLNYLALGDWHGRIQIDERTWYAGTPEPDAFDTGGAGGGEVLLVELTTDGSNNKNVLPTVTPLPVGRFVWRTETALLTSVKDVAALESRIRGQDADLSRILLRLQVEGTLDLAAREEFEQRITIGLASALRFLRLEADGLHLKPSAADLDAIDHLGFVRDAADRLANMAADPQNQDRELAEDALQRLYIMHMRQESEAR